jgi:hypothetical protein
MAKENEEEIDSQNEEDNAGEESGNSQPSRLSRILRLSPAPAPARVNQDDGSEDGTEQETSPTPKPDAIEDFVNPNDEEKEYLFGTEHPLIDNESDMGGVIDMSSGDKEFLYGTGKKVKYSVGGKKSKKGKRNTGEPSDEFLFGTKGAL